mmetsp:Transcript_63333/g.185167  ORF Transcript_63333/g.185167 Transcript_63333/m.185167 type:complete len:168 (-) Transcript_63333:67-570(-)
MRSKLLVLACLSVVAHGDAPAADTLDEMVRWIDSGKFANNFFHGGVLEGPMTVKEEVAGCLLDKVGAIVEEGGAKSFANDLQVDLAACCTKRGKKRCIKEVSPAYELLAAMKAGEGKDTDDAYIAAILLQAVRSRVDASKVASSHRHFLAACKGDPVECTMEALKTA